MWLGWHCFVGFKLISADHGHTYAIKSGVVQALIHCPTDLQ